MMWKLLSRLAVGVLRIVALRPGTVRRVPFPTDEPRVHVAGPDPDRILLYGSGFVAGLGVTSYRSSVLGHVARQISAVTRRGVDAEAVPDSDMTIRSAVAGVGRLGLPRYDAIVIAIGINDAFLRMPQTAWNDGVEALLTAIDATKTASSSVFLIAVGDPSDSPLYNRAAARAAATRARSFNRASRRIVEAHPGVTFLEFDVGPPEGHERVYASDSHSAWAAQFAGPIAEKLTEGFERGLTGAGYGEFAEPERQKAVDHLRIVDTGAEERFDRIVKTARAMFRTEAATFAVIDRDRAWLKSSVGVQLSQVDRAASFCNSTIGERNGLEVIDALLDPRFSSSPLVTGDPNVRFYLGYPVESRDGYPVGVLCVFDSKPREHDPQGINSLRELAVLIGRELAR